MKDKFTPDNPPEEAGPPRYQVSINHDRFRAPTKDSRLVGGVVYHRGGYGFAANTVIEVTDLEPFMISLPRKIKPEDPVKIFDPNLICKEIN